MKDETKQILKIVTQMQEDMVTKGEFGELKSDVEVLKSDVAGMKVDIMQNATNIAKVESTLFNQISAVHEDLSKRIDNTTALQKKLTMYLAE